jgi:hypothetical protein
MQYELLGNVIVNGVILEKKENEITLFEIDEKTVIDCQLVERNLVKKVEAVSIPVKVLNSNSKK